jgi:hypothetical protein
MKQESRHLALLPRSRGLHYGRAGASRALHPNRLVPKRGTPRQGVKRAPTAAQNLRHEQRRNRESAPARVGWLMPNADTGAERP